MATATIQLKTSNSAEAVLLQNHLQTLADNITPENLKTLARLSKKFGVNLFIKNKLTNDKDVDAQLAEEQK